MIYKKYNGGILLNYDYVKKNLINYFEEENKIELDFAQKFSNEKYIKILEEFIKRNNYNLKKVKLLIGIIYLNMSPLHHFPFDKLLNALGRMTLKKELIKHNDFK